MGVQALQSRALIGEYYRTLSADPGVGWVDTVSTLIPSDQESEDYAWLGMPPQMREWVGGRSHKGFRDEAFTIRNKAYEATVDILLKWLRRDKTGQAAIRIRELAMRSNSHWAKLLSDLLLTAHSAVCYDGQFFFDTDHSEGDSGTQDNDLTVDISALPALVHGSVTAPSPEEFQQAALQGVTQITSFVDDQGEPMNENAQSFLVMVAPSFQLVALNAFSMPRGTGVSEQVAADGFRVRVAVNARLGAWTDKFAVFREDGQVKSLIRQEEQTVDLKVQAEGSPYEFENGAHSYGVDASRNVGFGQWQDACSVTMI